MINWFERKFSFDHLEGTLPCILERLQGTPLRLESKIAGIPAGYYTQSLEKAWSIQQHVGHLGDLEPLWENRFKDYLKGRSILSEADLANTKTHQAHHNAREMEELLQIFRVLRADLCTVILSIGQRAEQWQSKHPRLGTPMRPIDLAYFVAEHDDHHLAKISQLYGQLNTAAL